MNSTSYAGVLTVESHHSLSTILKSVTLMTIICAGAIQNAAIIYAIVKDRYLHRAPYYFVINYVIADLLRATLCLPFVHAAVIHGTKWQYSSSACKLLAFTSTFLVYGSLFALLVLVSERILFTLHRKLHARRLSGGVCLSMVLLGWTIAFLLAFTPVFTFPSYKYSQRRGQCTAEYSRQTGGISAVVFLVVMTLTMILYVMMFVYLRRRRRMKPVIQQPTTSSNWSFYLVPDTITSQPLTQGEGDSGSLSIRIRQTSTTVNSTPQRQLSYLLQPQQQQPIPSSLQPSLPPPRQLQSYYIPLQLFHAQSTEPPVNDLQPDNGHMTFWSRYASAPQVNNQLTRALFIMTSSYNVLWLPYIILMCCYAYRVDSVMLEKYVSVATWFTYLQVAVVPLVYILSHRPVRKHVLGRHNAECDATAELRVHMQDVRI